MENENPQKNQPLDSGPGRKRASIESEEAGRKRRLSVENQVLESSIHTTATYKDRKLFSVLIDIRGPLSALVSVANSKRVYKNKRGRNFIGLDSASCKRRNALVSLFLQSCENPLAPPTFGKELVEVICFLGKRNNRFDSHNYCKFLGDYLEDIGMISNDSQADISCRKKNEYSDLIDSSKLFGSSHDSTTVFVMSREPVRSLIAETLKECFEVGTGKLDLIG